MRLTQKVHYPTVLAPLRCFSLHPKGFFRRTRGRIYVAFGEHPAAGVCVCVCSSKLLCVCVCSIVCFFVSLFVSLVGWLFVGIWFFCVVWSLGHLLVRFFCKLGEFFMCVLHLWRPWGSIVAPGAPFWEPWATCCRFFKLFVALGLNFDTPGLHLVTLWRPFWCLIWGGTLDPLATFKEKS